VYWTDSVRREGCDRSGAFDVPRLRCSEAPARIYLNDVKTGE
jgi:hypothetical protein